MHPPPFSWPPAFAYAQTPDLQPVVRSACRIDGGLNPSEFARHATIDVAHSLIAGNDCLRNQLSSLGLKLSRLDSSVGELVSTLRRPRGQ